MQPLHTVLPVFHILHDTYHFTLFSPLSPSHDTCNHFTLFFQFPLLSLSTVTQHMQVLHSFLPVLSALTVHSHTTHARTSFFPPGPLSSHCQQSHNTRRSFILSSRSSQLSLSAASLQVQPSAIHTCLLLLETKGGVWPEEKKANTNSNPNHSIVTLP